MWKWLLFGRILRKTEEQRKEKIRARKQKQNMEGRRGYTEVKERSSTQTWFDKTAFLVKFDSLEIIFSIDAVENASQVFRHVQKAPFNSFVISTFITTWICQGCCCYWRKIRYLQTIKNGINSPSNSPKVSFYQLHEQSRLL